MGDKGTRHLTSYRLFAGSLVIGAVFSRVASTAPDGLERTAHDLAFTVHAAGTYAAPFADYLAPGVPNWLATSIAGVVGACVAFGVLYGVSYILSCPRVR